MSEEFEPAVVGAGDQASAALIGLPVVAVVGRPNVGKSTLFNRLVGHRQAIVHDKPGVTRDRITGTFDLGEGRNADIIDTGGLVPQDDPLGLNDQVKLAIEEADALIFVVDGRAGLVPPDQEVTELLWRYDVPVVVAVNKADTNAAQESFHEFYELGFEHCVLLSAEHGTGIPDLTETLRLVLPAVEGEGQPVLGDRLAIVGRPNVGKSSLINQLSRQERALVSPIAGTTRDPIDTKIEFEGRPYWLVDTAGIRRRSQVSEPSEEVAVMMAKRQIAKADLAFLIIDASAGITTGDLAIADAIWDQGKPCVVLINKWDLLQEAEMDEDDETRMRAEESWERLDEILSNPPRVNISALTGRHIDRVLKPVPAALERWRTEISTSEANRLFERALQRHQPPAHRGRPWNLLYATQVTTAPPTFMLFANRTIKRQDPYRRYLENSARRELELDGIPIRLIIRERSKRAQERGPSGAGASGGAAQSGRTAKSSSSDPWGRGSTEP